MWHKLRRLEIVDASGEPRELIRLTPEQTADYSFSASGQPQFFTLQHDVIRLFPTPSESTEKLRQWIYRRPNRLVSVSSAARVLSVASGVVTYSGSVPVGFTSTSTHDFFKGSSPFRRVATGISATAATLPTQTFPTTSAALLSSNDYVCMQDETIFPACPIELVPFLKDLVIRSLSRTNGDQSQYETQRKEIMERIKAAMVGPGQRIVGHPKKISLPQAAIFGAGRIRIR